MNAGQFTKNVLDLDDNILFAGIIEKSGHLRASNQRAAVDDTFRGRNLEMVYSQAVYVADLRKMLSPSFGNLNSVNYVYEKLKILLFPVKDHVLLIFIGKETKTDDLAQNIRRYMDSLNDLDLYSA